MGKYYTMLRAEEAFDAELRRVFDDQRHELARHASTYSDAKLAAAAKAFDAAATAMFGEPLR